MLDEKKNTNSKVTIKIPRPLYDKLATTIEGSGYNSVTDFVTYVLRDLVASRGSEVKGEISNKEMDDVKQRLKALGYL